MKLVLRFVIPLLAILGVLAYGLLPLVDHLTNRWFVRDLDIRSRLIVNAITDELDALLVNDNQESRRQSLALLKKTTQDERLLALAICSTGDKPIVKTELFPSTISCRENFENEPHTGVVKSLDSGDVHVSFGFLNTKVENKLSASNERALNSMPKKIILLHDMSFASRRSQDTKQYLFAVFLGVAVLISAITVLVARWSMADWVKSVRTLVTGIRSKELGSRDSKVHREFLPILKDLKGLVRDLEGNVRQRDDSHISWDPASIRKILVEELSGEEVIVVSNRQPYIHNRKGTGIEVQSPASGLVTALEPILKACSGTWIAHGNGTADKDVVDTNDRVRVPPGREQYDIHRVWLSKEEENGYYYGFANEGLWPLCHIAHTRPIFRKSNWEQYIAVNAKFADTIVTDAKSENPVVLVQDYHFALVPKMLRERLPNATIITFWHIPWPNPESFGICPWREEILEGLLGSSIIGFHTQFHCNNFIDSVDRFLESRIDRETNSVSFRSATTDIRPYPISIEWPPEQLSQASSIDECRSIISTENSLSPNLKIGVGIDRLDYTKGIIERLRAVERLFQIDPTWIGQFVFIQIAAPSRSSIGAYQELDSEVRTIALQINATYGSGSYQPIILRVTHHEPNEVLNYYRGADMCFVTSLHDGMNLVAKEFVASRDDEQGVLVLSMFAGASRELAEALIINPYDTDQSAAALKYALDMHPLEQRDRMRALRSIVKEFNVYRWAGRMLLDAARVRNRNRFQIPLPQTNHPTSETTSRVHPLISQAVNPTSGMNGIGVSGV